jgi:hypothetical protein
MSTQGVHNRYAEYVDKLAELRQRRMEGPMSMEDEVGYSRMLNAIWWKMTTAERAKAVLLHDGTSITRVHDKSPVLGGR